MGAKEAFALATHLRALLQDVETPQSNATTILADIQAAHQAPIGEWFSQRAKHVIVALKWVREIIINNTMTLKLIRTFQQAADFLRHSHKNNMRHVAATLAFASPTQEKTKMKIQHLRNKGNIRK